MEERCRKPAGGLRPTCSPGGGLVDKENTLTTGPEVTQDVLGPRGCRKGLRQAPGAPGAPLALPLGSENRMCDSGGRAPSHRPASSCLARCDSRCGPGGWRQSLPIP